MPQNINRFMYLNITITMVVKNLFIIKGLFNILCGIINYEIYPNNRSERECF